MNIRMRPTLYTAAIVAGLLAAHVPAGAIDLAITSGPNIKQELFRSSGTSTLTWEELAFSFPLPVSASGDGLLRLFAGGDLNNITIDLIDVTAGPFGNRTTVGTYAFPISDVHFTACENPPHTNPAGCPVPENVPGGMFFDPARGPAVGDVEGRRNVSTFSAGVAGLIVPQSLLVGGSSLTISLFPRDPIFDLYINRIELSYAPIPEPSTWVLLTLGLAALGPCLRASYRGRDVASPRKNSPAANLGRDLV